MLDINLIRENPELVKNNQKKAGKDEKLVDEILNIDKKWREKKQEADNLRAERNKISEQINLTKKQKKDVKLLIKKAKQIPDKIKQIEEQTEQLLKNRDKVLGELPNIISKYTPKGKDVSDNKEIKKWGKPIKFAFT